MTGVFEFHAYKCVPTHRFAYLLNANIDNLITFSQVRSYSEEIAQDLPSIMHLCAVASAPMCGYIVVPFATLEKQTTRQVLFSRLKTGTGAAKERQIQQN